ncbi:hypothetical protein MKW94_018341, partial [Papaver nudicaule]|nr:hypothetical protein [Papaver nudicaule]
SCHMERALGCAGTTKLLLPRKMNRKVSFLQELTTNHRIRKALECLLTAPALNIPTWLRMHMAGQSFT